MPSLFHRTQRACAFHGLAQPPVASLRCHGFFRHHPVDFDIVLLSSSISQPQIHANHSAQLLDVYGYSYHIA